MRKYHIYYLKTINWDLYKSTQIINNDYYQPIFDTTRIFDRKLHIEILSVIWESILFIKSN